MMECQQTLLTRHILYWVSVISLLCFCTGCITTYSLRNNGLTDNLSQHRPDLALAALEAQSKWTNRDPLLYDLNKGMLLHLLGRFSESNQHFESAKVTMKRLSTTSITGTLAAATISDTLRSYAGQPYEKLLLHAYMALNYLALGDASSARVEMLQADVKMREWASEDEFEGIKASAFLRYLSGLVFEVNGELGDALIAYRKAYKVFKENGQSIPTVLQKDLLSLTLYQGLKDEHGKFKKEFNIGTVIQPRSKKRSELIFIMTEGVITALQEQRIDAFSTELEHNVHIAIPYYPPAAGFRVGSTQLGLSLIQNEQVKSSITIQTEALEDFDVLARKNLEKAMPGITLRAVLRAVVKRKAKDEAKKEDALLGLLASIGDAVTERADTRSWLTLPSSIQIARIELPAGTYKLNAAGASQLLPLQVDQRYRDIELKAGEKLILSNHNLIESW